MVSRFARLLPFLVIAACAPRRPQTAPAAVNPVLAGWSAQFQDSFEQVLAARTSGFAAIRIGPGTQEEEDLRRWPASIALAGFDSRSCSIVRFDGDEVEEDVWLYGCQARVPGGDPSVRSWDWMRAQVSIAVPGDWTAKDSTLGGGGRLTSWSPPGELQAVELRMYTAGEDSSEMSITVWSPQARAGS
jgi:hypothetical protein